MPKVEDLFVKLAGGQKFSKLDLRQAYQQFKLDEESTKHVVLLTHSEVCSGTINYHIKSQWLPEFFKEY